jgi:hypothetical protein
MAENLFRRYAREAMEFLDDDASPAEAAVLADIVTVLAFASMLEERLGAEEGIRTLGPDLGKVVLYP